MNKYSEIDPYGEEIWENEPLYGLAYLESVRGQWPELDRITDRIILQQSRVVEWYNLPWWKKIFISKIEYIYK